MDGRKNELMSAFLREVVGASEVLHDHVVAARHAEVLRKDAVQLHAVYTGFLCRCAPKRCRHDPPSTAANRSDARGAPPRDLRLGLRTRFV
jgi:hypothetical protein